LLALEGCGRDELILPVDANGGSETFGYESSGSEVTTATETTASETAETETGPSVCGDGLVGIDEQCDDGNGDPQDECTNECTWAVCGDGIVWLGIEECDPGEDMIGPNEACVPGCFLNVCGDGMPGPGEACDDGNGIDGDGCNNDCAPGSCGDGLVDPGEQCDDGNADDTDACLSTCVANTCGDGAINAGVEECDDGGLNSDAADCTLACTVNVCGDGKQHATDEECDPGAGMIGPGMACLDGCVLNGCGDGDVGPGEQCDDGNADDTDACLSTCELASCGDGFVQGGVEECDDADANDDNACHNDCSATSIVELSLGGNHTCVRLDHGKIMCWGNGDDGRTGYGNEINLGDDELGNSGGFVSIGGPVLDLITGISHTCAQLAGGVRCFGRPLNGQLGYGNTNIIGDDELPSSVGFVDFGTGVDAIASGSGSFHSCAILDTGALACWGRAGDGRLGYALGAQEQDVGNDETPAQWIAQHGTVNVGGQVVQVVTGANHTCARLQDGSVRCWGEGNNGQLGYGNANRIGDNETPAAAGNVNIGGTATQITAGWLHTCALLATNQIKCWGRGNEGRLGYGNVQWVGLANTPASVGFVDVGGTPVKLSAGAAHTCALRDDQSIVCWGFGARGQLGYGNVTNIGDNETPASAGAVPVGAPVVDVVAEGNHTCALLDSGQIKCWGDAGEGRLGYGNLDWIGDNEVPASVGVVPTF
jgi:cysteine-rich repeat protein